MAVYRGIRGIGNMTPNERSATLQQARALKQVVGRINRALSPDRSIGKLSGTRYQTGASAGGRVLPSTSGKLSDRPTSEFLLKRGVAAMLYTATDSGVYWWNGTSWNGPL